MRGRGAISEGMRRAFGSYAWAVLSAYLKSEGLDPVCLEADDGGVVQALVRLMGDEEAARRMLRIAMASRAQRGFL